ncbi:effector protein HopD2 [Clostridium pasteurianum DSM 525 = ATCC 6013]|uniref:Effector protein HopD2 n=1 Tax=Clostridium pasteurianum DSM 525 = ATCC 6013 TaxID=1262449 RepID=A0A0H3J7M7_CLOPA|nr:protein-tyrosine phosphatase family protein [Clostridium pasteurianum]AJA47918.1 effector protein HopD2 [Clostridium pasteurianum DSM 525 = ATCC 6013]AJA51906.1 effector protein HopD2 [Clostridium pasteurianum DSM 525 = ATCC 6013]AOZ75206.1 phosphatase [Clostridium pasteurianum DSM 525 = ATCC 6013]AOZ79001.1 phosphatase [Clostridium pasteurianum]ELP59821.1 phosphatase [Clostridium pasteurianum DSM 525 = ATCC 6013]
MRKRIKLFWITFFIAIFSLSFIFENVNAVSFAPKELRLTLNANNTVTLPKNFRKTTDSDKIKDIDKSVNLEGMNKLNISGSGQFSEKGLEMAKENIGEKVPITVVDLREESHGFLNGNAISWTDGHNKANKGLIEAQVIKDENERLKKLSEEKTVEIKNRTLNVEKVENEENLTKKHGISYTRITVTDKEAPSKEAVDEFVNFAKSVPNSGWLHFHCKAGKGRTTTFMAMYDMMKNAKNVSFEDIIKRQFLLGGENLLKRTTVENIKGTRAKFLKNFYDYCRTNNDNFNTTWEQWLKNNPDNSR